VEADEVYAAMDWLLERQEHIERKLAARHMHEGAIALYDLSSSYFEGYREDGKVKNETVGNISHLPESVVDVVRRALPGLVANTIG
jgi:hypothetical protein